MAKHTPGPWSLPHFARPDNNCECGYVLSEEHFGAIATVHASGNGDDVFAHGDNPKFDQAVANARLIAAAPELLHAAIEAVEEIAYWHQDLLTENEPHPRGNGPLRVHQLLVDVIRKATGEDA